MKKIVLTGGGTAGHCTPHLAILPEIKKHFDKIYYIGSEKGIEKDIIERENIPYNHIPCVKLIRSFTLKNFAIPFTLIKGINKAKKLLLNIKPNIVFSKGGYVALPVVIAAHRLKIPVIAHESDLSVGLANKISANYCNKVLTSFPDTANQIKNGQYVGPPIRKSIFLSSKEKSIDKFLFPSKKPILLVTGGSQGSKKINDVLRECLDEVLTRFNVIHVTGKGNLINKNPPGYYQTEYLYNFEDALAVSDVCVSRAGSNTLFELLALKKNCLIIPLPKGNSRGDQIENAKYFKKKGVINVLYQEEMTPSSFLSALFDTYDNRVNLQNNLKIHPVEDKSFEIARILCDYS